MSRSVTVSVVWVTFALAVLQACATTGDPKPIPTELKLTTSNQTADSWTVEFTSDAKFTIPVIGIDDTAVDQIPVRPLLLVGTESGTVTLEAASGNVVWRRPDIQIRDEAHFAAVIGTDLALIESGDADDVIRLGTGATLWSSGDLPWARIDGYLLLPRSPILLVVGVDSTDQASTGAVRLEDGRTEWTSGLWNEGLETGHTSRIQAHLHLMPPLYLEDTLVVLWGTKDGPIALNPLSGTVAWTVPSLKGVDVPRLALRGRRAAWLINNAVIYMPYEKRLAAIDARSGEVLWDVKLRDAAGKMEVVDAGLLVQGWGNSKGSLDLRDLTTGESVWGGATTGLTQPSAYIRLVSDQVNLATGKKLMEVSLADGEKHEKGEFGFEAGEQPLLAQKVGGRGCFASEQNVACLQSDASFAYRRYYPEPDKNLFRGIMNLYSMVSLASAAFQTSTIAQTEMMYGSSPNLDALFDRVLDDLLFSQLLVQYGMQRLTVRLGATNFIRERAVFLTKREDALGDNRWTVVEMDLFDGAEISARSLDKKPGWLLVDPMSERIIMQMDGSRLVALAMTPRTDGTGLLPPERAQ